MAQTLALKTYQSTAVEFAYQTKNSALWLEMGLGKTAITLETINHLLVCNEVQKVLVVAPKRVVTDVWPAEIDKWDAFADIRYTVLQGSPAERKRLLPQVLPHYDVFIVNYEMLAWWCEWCGKDWPFDMVIFDESTRMKNHAAKRVRAYRTKAMKHVDRCLQLTGTPAPNGLINLWMPIYLLDRGERLGKTLGAFRTKWFKQIGAREWQKYQPLPDADDEIHNACKDICLSMRTADHIELPELIDNVIPVHLPANLKRDYLCLEHDMYVELEGQPIEVFYSSAAVAKCIQFANGAVYHDNAHGDRTWTNVHDLMLDALDSIIEEANGAPMLVAYWFNFDLEKLKKRYPHGVTLTEDEDAVRDWNSGKIDLLFVQPGSGGLGLNLQDGGNVMTWFGPIPSRDLEIYEQMNARLRRPGQRSSTVTIHTIVVADTVHEIILNSLVAKASVQDLLMERMKRSGVNTHARST